MLMLYGRIVLLSVHIHGPNIEFSGYEGLSLHDDPSSTKPTIIRCILNNLCFTLSIYYGKCAKFIEQMQISLPCELELYGLF